MYEEKLSYFLEEWRKIRVLGYKEYKKISVEIW
jgi:hypothetical protein